MTTTEPRLADDIDRCGYSLSEGWAEICASEVGQWFTGGTPSRKVKEYFKGSIPWVKSGDLNDGTLVTTEEFITDAALKHSAAKLLPAGSVIIALYGATIGKLGILPWDAATNQACATCVNDERMVNRWFLFFYFLSQRQALIEAGQGGAQPNLSNEIVRNWPLLLPPRPEQDRIVNRVQQCATKVDFCKTKLKQVSLSLKRFRQSVLAAACSGRLTADWREENVEIQFASDLLKSILKARKERKERTCFGRYEEPKRPQAQDLPELPDAWCYASVDQLLSEPLANGRSVVTREGGFPVLRMTALKDGRLDLSERKTGAWTAKDARPFLVQKSDFLVARGNGSLALVGRGALLEDDPDPVAYPDTLIRLRLCRDILPRYLRLVWNSDFMRKQVEAAAHTTAGIHKVSQKDIASFVMPLCSREEQTEIVRRVEAVFKLADAIEKRVGAAQLRADKLTQSILAKAFHGELVPTEAELARQEGREYEPASVLLERIRAERKRLPTEAAIRKFRRKAGQVTRPKPAGR